MIFFSQKNGNYLNLVFNLYYLMINNMAASFQGGTVLSALELGTRRVIAEYTDPFIAGKLISMGILPGSEVEIVRRSLFGNSIYAKIEYSLVALRKEEAACIVLR